MKHIFIYLIKIYQLIRQSFPHRRSCVFYPTCSEYSIDAFKKFGIPRAIWLTFNRVVRCHPWQKQYFNPVPKN